METTYFYCAAIGGGILVLQTLLMVFGAGDSDFDTDVSADTDAAGSDPSQSVIFQLSLKTIVAFSTFFGLAGLTALNHEATPGIALSWASGAGILAFFLVGYLMQLLMSLQSQGNLRLEEGVGSTARVDLRIPGQNGGFGKIRVSVGGRTIVRKAVTSGNEIPTAAAVVITGMCSADTYEVQIPQQN